MSLNFEKLNGLIPAIVQHADSNEVLMLGFMNSLAYEKTVREGLVTFYSRTKKRMWTKGEVSGNILEVKEIIEDCDKDTLLIKALPSGPVCHTGNRTCFSDHIPEGLPFLHHLETLLLSRKADLPEGSYTSKLFSGGINKIAQKVGEEAVELVIEAKDNNSNLFLNEAADLLFHLMILLVEKGHSLNEVIAVLKERHS